MRRPSREERKPPDSPQQRDNPGGIDISLDRIDIDENRLHPTPIPGLGLLEPDLTLVDPNDWFAQPITGNLNELGGVDITISEDGCRVCVSARATIGWLTAEEAGSGAGFCYTKKECREPPPPPTPPSYPPGFSPTDRDKDFPPPFPPTTLSPGSHVIEVRPKAGLLYWTYKCSGKEYRNINGWGLQYRVFNVEVGEEGAILKSQYDTWDDPPSEFYYRCPPEYKKEPGLPTTYKQLSLIFSEQNIYPGFIYFEHHVGYQGNDEDVLEFWIHEVYLDGELLSNDSPPPKDDYNPPPPPPPKDKPMTCCRNAKNSEELLRKIARCVGTNQLPATLPKSFNKKRTGTEKIVSIPEFVQWAALQVSDLVGEFPKKIKIKDANLLEDGDQALEIELPNMSEAIADIYGSTVRATAVNEVLMAFATRMAVEICSVKSATLVGQSYSKATALALGYKFEEEKELVPFGFNFTVDATKLEDFLETTEKKITVWKCKEPSSAWEYFERLMYVAGLLKAKTLRKEPSTIADTIKRIKDLGLLGEDKIDDFINKLNESGFYNIDGDTPKPNMEKR